MGKNYLYIDGKKIELSEETCERLRKDLKMSSPLRELKEMLIKNKAVLSDANDFICGYCDLEETVIQVYLPTANSEWYWGVVETVKEFCSKNPSERWPYAIPDGSSGYMYISVYA